MLYTFCLLYPHIYLRGGFSVNPIAQIWELRSHGYSLAERGFKPA